MLPFLYPFQKCTYVTILEFPLFSPTKKSPQEKRKKSSPLSYATKNERRGNFHLTN
jgi:hypothetical protein